MQKTEVAVQTVQRIRGLRSVSPAMSSFENLESQNWLMYISYEHMWSSFIP